MLDLRKLDKTNNPTFPISPTNSKVQSPPQNTLGILKNLGPGLILAGSIVGSGELIATTRTGAEAHFDFLWLIIIGCFIKVFAQIEFGKHVITYGRSSLESLNELPGPVFQSQKNGRQIKANWILIFWFIMFISILGQQGGIVGGVGQALAITFPLTEEGKLKNETLSQKVALTIKLNEAKSVGNKDDEKALNEQLISLSATPKASDDLVWSIIIAVLQ